MGAESHLINVTNGDYCIATAESVASVCFESIEVKAKADFYGWWCQDVQLIQSAYELLIVESY